MNKDYKSIIFSVLIAGCSLNAYGQDIPGPNEIKILQDQPYFKGERQSEIRLTSAAEIGSNVLNAEMMLFRINDRVVDENYHRISVFSRFGFTGSAGIQYSHCNKFLRDSSLIWYAGVSSAMHLGAEVSPDLLKLALRGNKQFAGREIEFGNSEFQYYAYDRATFGLNGFYKNVQWKASINLIAGKDHYQGEIPTGIMRTSIDGDSITGGMYATWHYTEGHNYYNGYGAGLGFEVSGELGSGLFAKLSVNDVGYVRWNSVRSGKMNDYYNYQGYYYTFDRSKETGINMMDSLSADYVTTDSGSKVTSLPTQIRFELRNQILPNHYLGLCINYVKLAGYTPVLAVNHNWFLSPKFSLESSIGYGGFGTFQWMEKISAQIGEKFGLKAGIIGLEGLILTNKALNGGGFFELAYFFHKSG